jgi:TnsA endonuclease N terminal/TnsA endonuclease C terminal
MPVRTKWTEKRIERWLAEGRGQGEGVDYIPWYSVRDVSSSGVSHRPDGIKIRRGYELLSNNEQDVFYATEWDRRVNDVREQFPLRREATLGIAKALGINHPYYWGTSVPFVITVDFLVTLRHDDPKPYLAIDVKAREKRNDRRSLEKLEIAREYFRLDNTRHVTIYSDQIPKDFANNLAWIRYSVLDEMNRGPRLVTSPEMLERLLELIHCHAASDRPLNVLCADFDNRYGQKKGTGLHIAKLLLHNRRLVTDLNRPNLECASLNSFDFESQTLTSTAMSAA